MTPKQHAVLNLARNRIGLDDETYRAVLARFGGVESAKDLKPAGFKAVMQYFAYCGFESEWRKRTFGDGRAPGMATARQIETIRARWFDYAGSNDEHALNRWLERSYGVTALRFLTRDKASAALTGLKKMTARKAKPGNPATVTPPV